MYLEQMRYAWKKDKATEVVTDFIDYFDPNNKPRRWPDWLTAK